MSKKDEALKLALEALENSVDLVSHEARNAEELYGKYPTRLARIQGLVALEVAHEKAITAVLEALAEQPAQQEPVAIVDANDEGYWAEVLPDRSVKVGQPLYTSPPSQRKPLTIKQEQKAFEKWWIKKIGDKDDLVSSNVPKFTPTFYAITRVEYAWQAWQARAIEVAHGIKENT